ncbi:MAG: L-histidine N(alpha)-methyltransferase [Verrucomicrobiae bacterium]|nr:L-histidine N(alpha)-methyltransferase [Verrucomicrobiae bacterium]
MKAIDLRFDSSRFPQRYEAAFKQNLRERCFDAKWHYETPKQVAAWLRVHEVYSPARTDKEVQRIYQDAFETLSRRSWKQVVSLGCGGAQKDVALFTKIAQDVSGSLPTYTAIDIGSAMALTALLAMRTSFPQLKTFGVVADLVNVEEVDSLSDADTLFLLFGLIPNLEPPAFLKLLQRWKIENGLISVNLASERKMKEILPQYDNLLTKQWLSLLPQDLGFTVRPEEIEIAWQSCPHFPELCRIEASYYLREDTEIYFAGETFSFKKGEKLQLFYSYRYTTDQFASWLKSEKIEIADSWIASSQEEGVFWIEKIINSSRR